MYAVNRIPNKRRHRSTVRNGHVATYTDSRTVADEQAVRDAYKGECFDCAVRVVVHTFKALPKSRPKRIERERDTTKPDIDNVLRPCSMRSTGLPTGTIRRLSRFGL